MTILIKGTPDSGKSKKAEALAMELAVIQKKYYIATMIPYGEEGKRRVEKHRKLREGKGFVTIEKPTAVHELIKEIPDLQDSTCLLECMSNLIGNEMHAGCTDSKRQVCGHKEQTATDNSSFALEDVKDHIVTSVMELAGAASNMVIVTNSFPLEDASYDEDTRKYVKLVGLVNELLASRVDRVYELCESLSDETSKDANWKTKGEWKLRENT